MHQFESRAARAAIQHHPAIPHVLPPTGPVPADTRRAWALQAAARAESAARAGDPVTAATMRALSARQSAIAARPAAEMGVSL